jgi:hypothetical protein
MTKLHVSEIYVSSHDKSCNGVNLMQHDGSPVYSAHILLVIRVYTIACKVCTRARPRRRHHNLFVHSSSQKSPSGESAGECAQLWALDHHV